MLRVKDLHVMKINERNDVQEVLVLHPKRIENAEDAWSQPKKISADYSMKKTLMLFKTDITEDTPSEYNSSYGGQAEDEEEEIELID